MAIPSILYLYQDNDQYIEINGLCDATDVTSYINGATGTATLYDSLGNAVQGASSITLNYVSSSKGTYRGSITSAFDPAIGVGYTLKIDLTYSSAKVHLEIPVQVKVRASL